MFTNPIFLIAIIIILFLVGREVVCWYFKINNVVDLLKSIERKVSDDKQHVQNDQSRDLAQKHEDVATAKAKSGNFEAAIVELTTALSYQPNSPRLHFDLACLNSLEKNKGLSFRHLERAVECGFVDFEKIMKGAELDYLRSQPEFTEFIINGYRKSGPALS